MLTLKEHKPPRPRPDIRGIYWRALTEKCAAYLETQDARCRPGILFLAVKWIGSFWAQRHASLSDEDIEFIMEIRELVLYETANLTPRQLMTVFPITKEYDGARYGTKDYYSTMEALRAVGLDNQIGGQADEVLDSYCNRDVFDYGLAVMSAASEFVRRKTGRDPFVEWMETHGVAPHYLEYDPATGREIMRNSKTGEEFEIQRKAPRHPELVYEKVE